MCRGRPSPPSVSLHRLDRTTMADVIRQVSGASAFVHFAGRAPARQDMQRIFPAGQTCSQTCQRNFQSSSAVSLWSSDARHPTTAQSAPVSSVIHSAPSLPQAQSRFDTGLQRLARAGSAPPEGLRDVLCNGEVAARTCFVQHRPRQDALAAADLEGCLPASAIQHVPSPFSDNLRDSRILHHSWQAPERQQNTSSLMAALKDMNRPQQHATMLADLGPALTSMVIRHLLDIPALAACRLVSRDFCTMATETLIDQVCLPGSQEGMSSLLQSTVVCPDGPHPDG